MATARPFAYNPGTTIPGTEQLGDLSIGYPTSGFTNNPQYWNGPDEELGYVIAQSVSGNTQPTQVPDDAIILSSTYKGVDIQLTNNNQTATQIFGYQKSVLGETIISGTNQVMFSVLCNLLEPSVLVDSHFVGVGTTSMNYEGNPYGGYPGNDTQSIGFNAVGDYYYNGSVVSSGLPTWTDGDTIDIAISHGQYWWVRVNGGDWNNNPSADPTTLTNGLTMNGLTNFYPALCPAYQGIMTVLNYPKYGVPSDYNFLGNVTSSVGFFRSTDLTEGSFIDLSETIAGQSFASGNDAKTWLNNNGYWTSFVPLATPTPTVTNTPTNTNTPTPTVTSTSTSTPTPSITPTQTPTVTRTPTQTPTNTPTNTKTPTPTPTPGQLKVLFLGDGSVATIASNINTYITATGQSISYSAVTMSTNYTGSGNITKANYDVVMIYTNAGQIGTTTMANALTTFVGQGGSIVSGTFLWNLYPAGYNFTGTTTFNTNNQSNPVGGNIIITSATTITNGIGLTMPTSFNNGAITLNSGSAQLATYSDGTNLLALKTIGSATLVGINASPINIINSTSTITKMFGNAILYAGGKI